MKETHFQIPINRKKSEASKNHVLIFPFCSDVNCANHFVVTAFKEMPVFQKSDFESEKVSFLTLDQKRFDLKNLSATSRGPQARLTSEVNLKKAR